MKYRNTLQKGELRCLVFKEDSVWYAVGLEFNIVDSGDTPQEALLMFFEAAQGYLESARKIKARPSILNQRTEPEYEEMWQRAKEPRSGGDVFFAGRLNISQLARGRALVPT